MSKTDNTEDSWIYSLNQEELVIELINRSLPTDGPPSLLRERLLRSDRVSSGELNIVDSDYDLPKSEGHKLNDSQVTYYSDIDKDKVGTEDTVREMENLKIQDNIKLNKISKVSENNANSQNPTKIKTASRNIPSTSRDIEPTIDLVDSPEGQASYLGSQNNTKNKVDVFPQRSSLRSRVSHELENNIDRNRGINIDDYNDPEAPQVYNRRRDYLLDDRFVENTNYHPQRIYCVEEELEKEMTTLISPNQEVGIQIWIILI